MTLADLPVLNPSTPGKEMRRAFLVAALFAVFGALYALARAAAAAPPDVSASTDPVFGFAFPQGWGIAPAFWSGAATWPGRLATQDVTTTLAVLAIVILAIALIMVMHPDILSQEGPQYVSPARRILTVVVALLLAFVVYAGVGRIDDLVGGLGGSGIDASRRGLLGYAALSLLMFGGIWSFIGPRDFGRRIPLRISHGALGGLAVWAAITFATMLSREPRSFLTSSLDTFYTLLTVDAAGGTPGATAGWAISADLLTAAVAMAVAGAMLVATAPQSLGPGNRRAAAIVAGILGAFLAVVAFSTSGVTRQRARTVNVNITEQLQLERTGTARSVILLGGPGLPASRRVVRMPTVPTATADDCVHGDLEARALPAATVANIQRLTAWLESQGNAVTGATIRAASCRAALLALRWDIEAARAAIFEAPQPARIGALTYYLAVPNIAAATPAQLRRLLLALGDRSRYLHGSEAPRRFADLARMAGDTALEGTWRRQVVDEGAAGMMPARPAYTDGTIAGRLVVPQRGWRVGLLVAPDPTSGLDAEAAAPRAEGSVHSYMVTSVSTGPDGRFTFAGLRDGSYLLALLSPDGESPADLRNLSVRGDPGVFQLEPGRKAKDVGTITVSF
jgi:hypothetical protein